MFKLFAGLFLCFSAPAFAQSLENEQSACPQDKQIIGVICDLFTEETGLECKLDEAGQDYSCSTPRFKSSLFPHRPEVAVKFSNILPRYLLQQEMSEKCFAHKECAEHYNCRYVCGELPDCPVTHFPCTENVCCPR